MLGALVKLDEHNAPLAWIQGVIAMGLGAGCAPAEIGARLCAATRRERQGSKEGRGSGLTRNTNSGTYITAADQRTKEHIVEPFITNNDAGKGTGLGLGFARELADKSCGGLNCGGQPGEVATVEVRWPMPKSV
jgi:hypothetical protein